MDDMVIVSVDDHAIEPPTAFLRHYPEALRGEAPKIIDKNGADCWFWNDQIFPTIGLNAVVGRPRSEYGMEPTRFDQLREGCFDVEKRVDDMNVNGVLGSLCFPTFPGFSGNIFTQAAIAGARDKGLRVVRAYNDWHIHDWAGAAPGRFIPMVLLPIWDMTETVAEVKRVSALGVHAVAFPDNPSVMGLPSIHDEYWEPFWKACSDHEIVINCHIGTGKQPGHASDLTPIDAWITTMPMSISNAAADWLYLSVWKRYPNLRMVLSEGGIGWIPYFLERTDFTYEHHSEWTFTDFGDEKPSDIFKRHIICCFIDDKFGLQNLEYMNSKMVAYECDYPHSDTVWPNVPEYLWKSVKHLSDEVIDDVSHANTIREFNYDPFSVLGGRENCTVGALRKLGADVDTTPISSGGLAPDAGGTKAKDKRPMTSGDLIRMFESVKS